MLFMSGIALDFRLALRWLSRRRHLVPVSDWFRPYLDSKISLDAAPGSETKMSTETLDYLDAIAHLPQGATLVAHHVGWEDYERLLTALRDVAGLRVSYDEGRLEIMAPLAEHEAFADTIAFLARVLTSELGWKLEARGRATLKRQSKLKGAEPDECFYVQNAAAIIGKRLDLSVDPPPDIVVEIDLSNESLAKFPIYAALGVPEIWRYDGRVMEIFHLARDRYATSPSSLAFPFLSGPVMADFLEQSKRLGQDEALDAFRLWVQSHKP
jgi:Uma2 family endonuclease